MSEEEILRKAKDFIIFMNDVIENYLDYDYEENKTAYEDKALVQGLLDLYEKEKEKNKTLEELLQGRLFELYKYYKDLASEYQGNSISKDKLKEKIEKYNKIRTETPNSIIYTRMVDYIDCLEDVLSKED